MEFYKGTHRYILILGSLVFKFPRIPLFSFWKHKSAYLHPWRDSFFAGFIENFNEVITYLGTRHNLLVPVVFPLIIVNVYLRKSGVGTFYAGAVKSFIQANYFQSKTELVKLLTVCGHTFDQDQNFFFDGTNIGFVDYGETGIKKLIKEYGDDLREIMLAETRGELDTKSEKHHEKFIQYCNWWNEQFPDPDEHS